MSEKKRNFVWPPVNTIEAAKKASIYGVVAAGFSAAMTAFAATWALGAERKFLEFIDASAYLDAAIFAAIAYGIYREKRWVAVFGLAFFLFEKAAQFAATGTLHGAWMAIILVLCYVAAIRGVYALHKLRRESGAQPGATADSASPRR